MSELLRAAFCVAVGRATTDADVNGEPMMLAVAHAQRVSGLEAENDRLRATLQACDAFVKFHHNANGGWWNDPAVRKLVTEHIEPVLKACQAQPKPTDAQLARYHGDVDGDAEL